MRPADYEALIRRRREPQPVPIGPLVASLVRQAKESVAARGRIVAAAKSVPGVEDIGVVVTDRCVVVIADAAMAERLRRLGRKLTIAARKAVVIRERRG